MCDNSSSHEPMPACQAVYRSMYIIAMATKKLTAISLYIKKCSTAINIDTHAHSTSHIKSIFTTIKKLKTGYSSYLITVFLLRIQPC